VNHSISLAKQPPRRAAYLRLCRALEHDPAGSLSPADRDLLLDIAKDVFGSAGAGTCQAGAAVLAGLVQSGRLDQPRAAGLWEDLCDCGPPGSWRPFASIMALAALTDYGLANRSRTG
jgi:hypothetical protein